MSNEMEPILFHIPEVSSSDITQLSQNTFRLVGKVPEGNTFRIGERLIFHMDDGGELAIEITDVKNASIEFKALD